MTWSQAEATYRRLELLIIRDDDGGYSAVAMNLPGVGGSGDSIDRAVADAKQAAQLALESYGNVVPWRDPATYPIDEHAVTTIAVLV